MQSIRFRLALVVMLAGLFGFAGCSKTETPQPPTESPSALATPAQASTPAPGPADPSQPSTATAANTPRKGKVDACTLLTSAEIQSVQGEALKETKLSDKVDGGLSVSQCFFTLPTFTKSIALTVMQKGDDAGARDPREFWKETFHGDSDSKKETDKDRERGREAEEEKSAPPEKISGLGTEAFWSGSRVGGALYVLKGNSFIRLSIGGADDQKTRIRKSKAIAQLVLKHI